MSPSVLLRTSAKVKQTAGQRARRAGWKLLAGRVMRATQEHRRSQFAALGVPAERVVFLGDSISEGGLWHEWFPHVPVLNRGIGGETSSQVLDRLDTALNAPAAVFLLIGTNDIAAGVDPAETTRNVRRIVETVLEHAPDCRVFVQSIMPRTAAFHDAIVALNHTYETIAASSPRNVHYLNLWPALAAPDGTLRADFTEDNVHLNGDGYRAWTEVLRPHVTHP